MRHVDIGDAGHLPGCAGVVEEAVEPPERGQGPLDHRLDLRFLGNVGANEDRLRAEAARQRLALRVAPAGDDDLGAFRDESLRRLGANSAGRAGDDRDLAIECAHFLPPPRLHADAHDKGRGPKAQSPRD
jgi:hypothetical protein